MSEPASPYAVAIERLRSLYEEACRRGVAEPNTAALATVGGPGRPSVRTVSILEITDQGPLFFVNARSGKGRQLAANPAAALCFFWPALRYQVLVEGEAEALADDLADRYWARRPHDMRLVARAAERHAATGGDETLEDHLRAVRRELDDAPVPRPSAWQLIRLQPDVLQFWRLDWRHPHAPERYALDVDGGWRMERQPVL